MIEFVHHLSEALIVTAVLLTLVRLVRGPSSFDRLLAVETIVLGVIGLLLLQASAADARLYVDVALGLALFSFVGTVFFARFLERGEIDD